MHSFRKGHVHYASKCLNLREFDMCNIEDRASNYFTQNKIFVNQGRFCRCQARGSARVLATESESIVLWVLGALRAKLTTCSA